jgi:hypothetical protein
MTCDRRLWLDNNDRHWLWFRYRLWLRSRWNHLRFWLWFWSRGRR